jgi:hypothetical protein
MFEWYATGNYSLLELAKKSHQHSFTFRTSDRKIPKSVIHKIPKNPLYYGEFRWAGKLYQGTHEPLISGELFDRVQVVMREKGRRKTGQQKHNRAFQGLLTCGHCGCALVAEIKKKQYIYYHCTRNNRTTGNLLICLWKETVPTKKKWSFFRRKTTILIYWLPVCNPLHNRSLSPAVN